MNDLRLEEFELPPIRDDEILARVVSDSICMSSHKLAMQGDRHKRVRHPLKERPAIIGHEFCGDIVEVGAKHKSKFKAGQRFSIQPALNYQGSLWAPGYSYEYIGGDSTYVVIPAEVMLMDCLLEYRADNYYMGSLSEPVSCVIGAFHAQYHSSGGSYEHRMGIVRGGSMAILAGVGPMGMGAIDYAIHCGRRPKRLIVTDIDAARLGRAASILSPEEAAKNGVELVYVDTKGVDDPVRLLVGLNGGNKFDDVFVMAPVKAIVETADRLLGNDGCLNFFAGPTDPDFSACMNFYDVHYASHHLVGTSGGNTEDMREALSMMAGGLLDPVMMITHVGGLDCVPETTVGLDRIPGGKKLIYVGKRLELMAIDSLAARGERDPFCAALAEICSRHGGLWSKEAEDYLLERAPDI
jgi:threonine dehydrogenase-like Zn-dependent dehydrogenase